MKNFWGSAVILGALMGIAVITPASATPTDAIGCPLASSPCTINLSTYVGSGTPGVSSPYGTITLTDIGGGGVSVSVSLNANVYFAETGAGLPLLWDWSGTALTAVNVTSIVFTGPGPISTAGVFDLAPGHEDGSGSWQDGVDCSGASGCGNGGSSPHYDGLTFTIGVGNIDNFALNDAGNNFASDLCLGISDGRCIVTGDVLGGGSQNHPVPEPLTLSLFGAGLAGFAALRRRKVKA